MTRFIGGFRYVFFVIPILFLASFFFYPLINIFRITLTSEAVSELFSNLFYWKTVWFTFWQATLSTILTIVVGMIGRSAGRASHPPVVGGRGRCRCVVRVRVVRQLAVGFAAQAQAAEHEDSGSASDLCRAFIDIYRSLSANAVILSVSFRRASSLGEDSRRLWAY